MTKPLGIIVGLEAEARIARQWGLPVHVGGGGPAGAAGAAEALAPSVSGIISFGLAGGLAPTLHPGDLVIPHRVVDGDEAWNTDPALSAALGGLTGHILRGGGEVLVTVAAKRAAATQADAVDLESAAVARTAARHGFPFAVLRAICDDSQRSLPAAALVALDGAGRIGLWRVIRTALANPHEIPALIALGRDAAHARAALAGRIRATPALNARA